MRRTDIQFLSPREPVNMADEWFGIISPDHFWLKRRFEVLKKFAGDSLHQAERVCEVGCGSGVLQRQVEEWLGCGVDGFDLNENSLVQNQSRNSRLFYYNIYDRREEFRGRYGAAILFDVLEHVREDVDLLKTLRFYLSEPGKVFVNVPALPSMYSKYDTEVGHLRRYSVKELHRAAGAAGFQISRWTFWGFPLLHLLLMRKGLLEFKAPEETVRFGMSPRHSFWNGLLFFLCSFEKIPQHFTGSSLMALLTPLR